MLNEKKILAIETSCDETSAAIVADGKYILSNIVSSQVQYHKEFGGVVPEIASRKHMENIVPVVRKAFLEAGCDLSDIDAVAVTHGPGLVGALLVGLSFGKAAAYALGVPLIGVNHLVGHIYAGFLTGEEVEFPFMSLVVSGGHTSIIYIKDHGDYKIIGQTRDDAAGEVFDKVARAMGLGYPGGPEIEKLARKGNAQKIKFPRAWLEEGSYDFSFSGLKSAVLNYLHNAKRRNEEVSFEDTAAAFQEAVVEVLVEKTIRAALERKVSTIILVGGVAANKKLRAEMALSAEKRGLKLIVPPPILCTDNAAMIACAAYYQLQKGRCSDLFLNAEADVELK
ncbi:MAG TPA: tRNA (adenosine(37)-N6)-threonylcarbamoyltransferase complex transferase subunit TsaD [Peptococcaceae bacterium]|nr:MAG: putative tRNA threonylcarbamoyladenosine biosynthesis protein Gcp [Clostridia bacterium 41_269]HBT20765.1 tRNA (adenosine(37)-N6)-threonylcarbamoyltransferase complex transferase subunit TsaD [Peptococcaceae bacterium]